ncbi:asparagine synthetase B [Geomonas limicola]|uniref:asparagine synthase (glutamine-hydrolyzing) n=2 Tax=Geomonas limicola TaxID=2740186 RepID=A0A6V8NB21_9BACT|nr:asparagine synthetase B [Geomonas limicola]
MVGTLEERGPDGRGHWCDAEAGVALGHTRLAILDLSQEGHQPMHSACGRYVITFNGEIYNFAELRRELEVVPATGDSRWRGHSDTEVLLAGFAVWGVTRTLAKAVGMFAFALWDRRERRLYLGRDRLGEKPLYYGFQGEHFLFGSQLKALRAHPAWQGEVSRSSLSAFLRFGYLPAPQSIYSDIHSLVPGNLLVLDCRPDATRQIPEPHPYWSLLQVVEAGSRNLFRGSTEQAVERLDTLLRRAVRQQMVADVPLGAFLSGGVDSSTVVALMQAQSGSPVRTFTIGFEDQGYNEAAYASEVARHLGTRHNELMVTSRDALELIPRLPELYDEPFADASQIPTHLLSRLTRRHVTVSLSGDGGDELFGGYNRYLWVEAIWDRIALFPKPLRRLAARLATSLSPAAWDRLFTQLGATLPERLRQTNPGGKLHKLASVLDADDPLGMYRRLVSHWHDPSGLVQGGDEHAALVDDPRAGLSRGSLAEQMMYLDALSYLPGDILVKVDRASMGAGLESRTPFLDHRVVEFAWQLPLSLKLRGAQGKWLLRQVLYRYVPRELVERPKAGFAVPLEHWLRGPLRPWAEELLNARRLEHEGYLNPAPIESKWREHLSGGYDWQYPLWNVLMFQAWLEAQGASAPEAAELHR